MSEETPRRARNMAEYRELQRKFDFQSHVASSIASYQPRPTDIIISPFGKSGTTWLQQTFHCLRTGGDMDFDDISRVVPWIEATEVLGIDINAPQRAEPRGFKAHLTYAAIPKGARYVVVMRDPKDVVVSMYRFMDGWFLEPGTVPIAEFARGWLGRSDGMDYWRHLVGWWEQRDNPDVLLLSYEHMTTAHEANIRRLAAFCGIPLDQRLLELTLEQSSLPFMLAHKDKFDDLLFRRASEERSRLPPGGESSKVRTGQVGRHRTELPPMISAAMDARWARIVTPALGFRDFASFNAALRARA